MKKTILSLCLLSQAGGILAQGLVPVYYTAEKLYGYHNYKNEQVIAPSYEQATALLYQQGCFVKTAKGYGAINAQGKEIVKPQYENVEIVGQNGYFVFSQGDKKFVHDQQGKLVLQGEYRYVLPHPIKGTFAVSNKAGSFGLVNEQKNTTDYPYPELIRVDDGYFIAKRKDDKWGLVLPDGTETNFEYSSFDLAYERKMDDFSISGPMIFSKNILFDSKTKSILKLPYDKVSSFGEEKANGLLKVEKNGKKGVINLEGKELIPCAYADIFWCSEAQMFLTAEPGQQFFNREGKRVGNSVKYAECFRNGLAVVQNDQYLYGYLNTKGEMALAFQYKEALKPLSTTDQVILAVAEAKPSNPEKPWLLLELLPDGKTKTLGSYEELSTIPNGQAYKNYLKSSKKYQIVFAPGFNSPVYDQIDSRFAPWITVQQEGKQGAFYPNGHSLLGCEYDPYVFWSAKGLEHLIFVKHAQTQKKGIFDAQKKQWLVAPEYERIDHFFFSDDAIAIRKTQNGPIEQVIIPHRGLIFSKK